MCNWSRMFANDCFVDTNKPRCVPDENCGEEEGGVVSGGGSSFLYHHVPHQELIGAANRGEYLELGKYNEYFFGTKYDTIDRIIASHLIPVLDIEPDVRSHFNRNFRLQHSSVSHNTKLVKLLRNELKISSELK